MSEPTTRFGRFRLEALLGRGAQASVWQATRDDGRVVALKVADAAALLRSPDALARVQREARIAREQGAADVDLDALEAPCLVPLVDAGEAEGRPWLAYALVRGARPLDRAWAGAPRDERVRLVRDAARALASAHARGVVHRDVSPANVLVDERGRVRVADLGLAWAVGEAALTRTGAVLGTPRWLAPEVVLEGNRAATSPRNDVWSLGVLLHEALAGAPPWDGLGLTGGLERAAQGPPPLPPDVPPALAAVAARALAFRPEERFADAGALAQALDPGSAPGEPGPRRAPALAAAGALLGLAALAAMVAALATPAPPAPGPRVEALRREVAARVTLAPSLAALDLAALASEVAALDGAWPGPAPRPPALEPSPARAAAEVWAWVGLSALAQGDDALARACAERVATDQRAPASALRGGLLREREPARALRELTRAAQGGLEAQELGVWQRDALVARGATTASEADELVRALAPARRRETGPRAEAQEAARVLALVTLGRVAEAEAALAALPAPPPRVAWAVARLAAQDLIVQGDVRRAWARLASAPRPADAPDDPVLAARALDLVGAPLARASRCEELSPLETQLLCEALALHARLSPGAPPPAPVREALMSGLGLLGLDATLALAAADAFPRDAELRRLVLAHGRARDVADLRRLEALARATLAAPGAPAQASPALARALEGLGRLDEAIAEAQRGRDWMQGLDAVDRSTRRELEAELWLVESHARRKLGDAHGAVLAAERALPLMRQREAEAVVSLMLALDAAGRGDEALERGLAYVRAPSLVGPGRKTVGELVWQLADQRRRLEAQDAVVAYVDDQRVGDDAHWQLRRAIVYARAGDLPAAVDLLLHLPDGVPTGDLPYRIARGEASAIEALRDLERKVRGSTRD